MELTKEQIKAIDTFLFSEVKKWLKSVYKKNPLRYKRMWHHSYSNWYKGGNGYSCIKQGGTGQMYLRMWYHHKYKKHSNEWRPKIIIKAVLSHLAY